jgi:acetylornithine deacetylase/succinyl-diaminopimelate desuccinylase-like protein
MPSVDIGVCAEDAAIHAPNENLRLDLLQKGILWIADTIEGFAAT